MGAGAAAAHYLLLIMPLLTLPFGNDGYLVDVLIGLPGTRFAALQAAGTPMPPPLQARGIIDPGSDVTCIAAAMLQQLGLVYKVQKTTRTTAGMHSVNIFEVSLSVVGPAGIVTTQDQLDVMELAALLPGIDVIIGRDVLAECFLFADGPGKRFSLAS
jgi:hypothetical protein